MFEKEIQTAKQQLSSHLLTDEIYVYLHEVLSKPEVPGFYKTFFGSEVDWWIYEQRMLREVNPRFNFADGQFGATLTEFDSHCRRTARFDHAELVSLIDLAVKTRVNYLLRPRTTLKWFIYRGEPTKPLREVLLRLAYFDCYGYLTGEFTRWAHTKLAESQQQDILSVIEFERLIENIDNDIILEHTTSEFTQLLTPLYEFFNEVQPEARRDVIPTPALIIFLDDKGILRISQELERLMKEHDLDMISRDQFLRVIEDVITQVEDEAPPGYMDATTIPLDFDRSSGKKSDVPPAAAVPAGSSAGQGEPEAKEQPTTEPQDTERAGAAGPVVQTADTEPDGEPDNPSAEIAAPEVLSAAPQSTERDIPEIAVPSADADEVLPDATPAESEHAEEELSSGRTDDIADVADRKEQMDIPVFSLKPTFFQNTEAESADEPEDVDSAVDVVPEEEASGLSRALAELSLASTALRAEQENPEAERTDEEPDSTAAAEPAPLKESVVADELSAPEAGETAPAEVIDEPDAMVEESLPVEESSLAEEHEQVEETEISGIDAGDGNGQQSDVVSDENNSADAPAMNESDKEAEGEIAEADFIPAKERTDETAEPNAYADSGSAVSTEDNGPDTVESSTDDSATEAEVWEELPVADTPEADPASFYSPEEQPADAVPSAVEEPEVTEIAQEPDVLFISDEEVGQKMMLDEFLSMNAGDEDEPAAATESAVEEPSIPVSFAPSLKRVEDLLDDSLKQRVLKHIFHKNESRFHSVVERLNATHSWRDASAIIDRVFSEHEVDPYSSIARKFSDIVYERFLTG